MKNLLTITLLLLTWNCTLFSQECEINPTYVDSISGVYPLPYYEGIADGGIKFHPAINCPYEFTFQFVVNNNVQGDFFELDYMKLEDEGALLNLPEGLTYSCNPPDCVFEEFTNGCLFIQGTPTTNNIPDTFDLKIVAEFSLLGNQLIFIDTMPGAITNGGDYYLALSPEPDDLMNCPQGMIAQQIYAMLGFSPSPYNATTMLGGFDEHPTIGCPYDYSIEIDVSDGSTADNPFDLDYIQLNQTNAILNLPEGIVYTCDPPDCTFPANTTGTISFSGTPTANNTPGTYDLKILTTVSTQNGQLLLNDTLPSLFTNGENYFMELAEGPPDPMDCFVNTIDVDKLPFSATIFPNPTESTATLSIAAQLANELNFKLVDLTGSILQDRVLNVTQGINSFEVMTSNLQDGVYFYFIESDAGMLSSKLIKN